MFSCDFYEIFKNIFLTEHLRITASFVYLFILRSLSHYLFQRTPLGDCLFHVQVAEFHLAYTVTIHTYIPIIQAFCIRTWSSDWKGEVGVIWLKSVKLPLKKLICSKVARCLPARFWKKLFYTYSLMYFALIFSERITSTSSEEALKLYEHSFCLEVKTKSSDACILPA